MARVLELGEPSPDERSAIDALAAACPDDWIVTTPARGVGRSGFGRELDCIVLTNRGMVVVELKHWRGVVRPTFDGPWNRETTAESSRGNPFQQAEIGSKALATFLQERYDPLPKPCFVDYLVVLTHPEGTLEVDHAALGTDAAQRVATLSDAPEALDTVLRRRTVMRDADLGIVELLLQKRGLDRDGAEAELRESNAYPEEDLEDDLGLVPTRRKTPTSALIAVFGVAVVVAVLLGSGGEDKPTSPGTEEARRGPDEREENVARRVIERRLAELRRHLASFRTDADRESRKAREAAEQALARAESELRDGNVEAALEHSGQAMDALRRATVRRMEARGRLRTARDGARTERQKAIAADAKTFAPDTWAAAEAAFARGEALNRDQRDPSAAAAEYENASKDFRRAVSTSLQARQKRVQELTAQAKELVSTDTAKAAQAAEEALRLAPKDPAVRELRLSIVVRTPGFWLRYAEELAVSGRHQTFAWMRMALVHAQLGNRNEYQRCMERSTVFRQLAELRHRLDARAVTLLALAAHRAGDKSTFDAALKRIQYRAVEHSRSRRGPGLTGYTRAWAEVLAATGQREEAAKVLRQRSAAGQPHPSHDVFLASLAARDRAVKGKLKEARAELENAIRTLDQLLPTSPNGRLSRDAGAQIEACGYDLLWACAEAGDVDELQRLLPRIQRLQRRHNFQPLHMALCVLRRQGPLIDAWNKQSPPWQAEAYLCARTRDYPRLLRLAQLDGERNWIRLEVALEVARGLAAAPLPPRPLKVRDRRTAKDVLVATRGKSFGFEEAQRVRGWIAEHEAAAPVLYDGLARAIPEHPLSADARVAAGFVRQAMEERPFIQMLRLVPYDSHGGSVSLYAKAIELDGNHWFARYALAELISRSSGWPGNLPRPSQQVEDLLKLQKRLPPKPYHARAYELLLRTHRGHRERKWALDEVAAALEKNAKNEILQRVMDELSNGK